MPFAIGIDLGGTNVRASRVSAGGEIGAVAMRPVDSSADGAGLVAQIAGLAEPLLREAPGETIGIGIGLPAPLAGEERRVLPGLSNLEGLVGYPFREQLAERLGLPVYVGNDANLIALGEAAFGAARGAANALALTLGTGIGGGLILDGRLREGPHGVAGEIGLMRLFVAGAECARGRTARYVALEEVASARSVGELGGSDAATVFARAEAGDADARELLIAAYEALGIAIANAHLLLDLERVALCGGMAQAGETLRTGVEAAFARHCPEEYRLGLQIVLGELGDAAGILGAAQLCFTSAAGE